MTDRKFELGAAVKWKWGSGWGRGEIDEIFTERSVVTIKGKRIVRNGTPEAPAYLIRQAQGNLVLKSGSELEPDA